MALAKTAPRPGGYSGFGAAAEAVAAFPQPSQENRMTWTTPAAQDLRFGFEITMYISAR